MKKRLVGLILLLAIVASVNVMAFAEDGECDGGVGRPMPRSIVIDTDDTEE